MSADDYILNGHLYHPSHSDDAQAAVERAGDANLITTVDGLPAWVFDGVCLVQGGGEIDGANLPDWSGDDYPYDH